MEKNCFIISHSGGVPKLHPFSTENETLKVPITHAFMQCYDPYSRETYMLARKEALCMISMKHNLIHFLIKRKDILLIVNLPKVQSKRPNQHRQSINFSDECLRMPLRSHVIFSYFTSKNPLVSVLNDDNAMLFLTTGNKNPHNSIYSENEQDMLDHCLISAYNVMLSIPL